jgi:hypothetical protein
MSIPSEGTTVNVTAATPVEIDTELARIDSQAQRVEGQRNQALKASAFYASKVGKVGYYDAQEQADKSAKEAAELATVLYALGQEAEPLEDEFKRRGGWTRAFIVPAGHVHNTTRCSTCNNGIYATKFHWLTEYSAKDEAEIVEAAGERACTVCYPTAPAETLSRPTRLFTPDEVEAQQNRDARAQKRAEKEAAQLINPLNGKVLFGTVRGATNAISSHIDSLLWYGPTHPSANEWLKEVRTILVALEARGEIESADDEWEARLAKARKAYPAKARRSYAEALRNFGKDMIGELNDKPKY